MPYTILVVEDEATNMQIIVLSLRSLGHHALEAAEPIEGMRLAREHRPDLILMDLMFKNAPLDGVEAIRRLKADAETRDIPVVAQTASVLDYTDRAVVAAGAAGFLHKPYRRQQLAAAIEAAIAGDPLPPPYAWRTVPASPVPKPTCPGT